MQRRSSRNSSRLMPPMFLPNLVRLVPTSSPRSRLLVSTAPTRSESEARINRYRRYNYLTTITISSPFFENFLTPKLGLLQLMELGEKDDQVFNSLSSMDSRYAPPDLALSASRDVVAGSEAAVSPIKSIQDWGRLQSLSLIVPEEGSSDGFCQRLLRLLTPT